MSEYVIYDTNTGRIERNIICPDTIIDIQTQLGENYLEHPIIDDSLYFISNRQVIERPVFDVSLNGQTLIGVPTDAIVTIEGVEYIADGTDIELSFSLPGTYNIKLSLFPFVDQVLQVVI